MASEDATLIQCLIRATERQGNISGNARTALPRPAEPAGGDPTMLDSQDALAGACPLGGIRSGSRTAPGFPGATNTGPRPSPSTGYPPNAPPTSGGNGWPCNNPLCQRRNHRRRLNAPHPAQVQGQPLLQINGIGQFRRKQMGNILETIHQVSAITPAPRSSCSTVVDMDTERRPAHGCGNHYCHPARRRSNSSARPIFCEYPGFGIFHHFVCGP
jgi:hypothetical protein